MKTITIFYMFDHLSDLRDPRGVRHKFSSILGLTFLGMLARIREMAVLVRWANVHWDLIKVIGIGGQAKEKGARRNNYDHQAFSA